MERVTVIGAGVLAQHIVHYVLQSKKMKVVGYYDDYLEMGTYVADLPVLGSLSNILDDFKSNKFDKLLMGIGYNHMKKREEIYDRFSEEIEFVTYIHPSSYVDLSVKIGKGVVVLPGCVFDKKVEVRNNVFFNISCIVSHESVIGSGCFFGPGVNLAGFVKVGNRCFLGIGAKIINNISLVDDTNIGAGAVVTKSIGERGTYIGVPAKLLNKD